MVLKFQNRALGEREALCLSESSWLVGGRRLARNGPLVGPSLGIRAYKITIYSILFEIRILYVYEKAKISEIYNNLLTNMGTSVIGMRARALPHPSLLTAESGHP